MNGVKCARIDKRRVNVLWYRFLRGIFFWPGPTFVSLMADALREREREFSLWQRNLDSTTKTRGKKNFLSDEIVHTSRGILHPNHKILNNSSPFAFDYVYICVCAHTYIYKTRIQKSWMWWRTIRATSTFIAVAIQCRFETVYKRLTFTVDCGATCSQSKYQESALFFTA